MSGMIAIPVGPSDRGIIREVVLNAKRMYAQFGSERDVEIYEEVLRVLETTATRESLLLSELEWVRVIAALGAEAALCEQRGNSEQSEDFAETGTFVENQFIRAVEEE